MLGFLCNLNSAHYFSIVFHENKMRKAATTFCAALKLKKVTLYRRKINRGLCAYDPFYVRGG